MTPGQDDLRAMGGETSSEHDPSAPSQATLPPLTVSALMVRKADLISALRVYLPHLSDIELIDGERFLLSVGPHPDQNGAA